MQRLNLLDKLSSVKEIKFSFGKSDEFHPLFSKRIGACSMYDPGFGLGIQDMSSENKLRAIFTSISSQNGIFVFNINGVDLLKAGNGFHDYDEAESNNFITEWELSVILKNDDYLKSTIFHNGKVEFIQIKKAIQFKWK
jgi:hypothetical protein